MVAKNMICQSKTRLGQVAADPAVDAQIDEGRERPDVFLVGGKAAQLAGEHSAKHVEGHRRPFAVQQRRERHQRAAQSPRQAAADYAE